MSEILTLETEGLLDDLMVRESRPTYEVVRGKLRVYADTSVIGGCLDEEFSGPSWRLVERCMRGEATLVVSDLTLDELQQAPKPVQQVLERLREADATEEIPVTEQAKELAERYIESGAIGGSMRSDAQHIAVATLAGVDVLASWNFRHIVNHERIKLYNEANRQLGHREVRIGSPREIEDGESAS